MTDKEVQQHETTLHVATRSNLYDLLEGLGIALAGHNLDSPVGRSIAEQASATDQAGRVISDSLDKVAAAIERLADVIEGQGETS